MALQDPTSKNLLRMEERRFSVRCDGQVSSIERADNLREVSRLATSLSLPYSLSASEVARDALRLMLARAESRARELVLEQVQHYSRADEGQREKLRRGMLDAWANLNGPLGHLRPWAQSKLVAAEQPHR